MTSIKYLTNNKKGILDKEKKNHEFFWKIKKYSDDELNDMDYKKAIRKDKRGYCKYYISLIKTKHLLFFSFIPSFDYNSRILKIYLFFFNFIINFIVNALFFDDDTMHKIYTEKGSYDFLYNLPKIIYSTLISEFINRLIGNLGMTDSNLISLKQNTEIKDINKVKEKTIKILKINFVLFFIINLILLVFFGFI